VLNRQLLAFLGAFHHDHDTDDSWSGCDVEQHWFSRSWRCQDWHYGQSLLEVIEGIISALGPNEMVHLLHLLIHRHRLLSEPADKSTERGQAAGKLLHIFELGGWF
jgi:hypothetical protein